MKKVCFVCLGNICRSPMAEFVMKSMTDAFEVESRATSGWEHGHPIHSGTQAIFRKYAIPFDSAKDSTQISEADFAYFDVIIGMDASNVDNLKKLSDPKYHDKIFAFDTESVPDPYYTGDFEETYARVVSGCQKWMDQLS
ncbi:low molecular weight protein-tyrosine-phosphatase [Streptococcus ovuberis]|uniref:protein-tyrosine-phosphatase n=1 Tax=Streptococcus ovuberis TaxID=1936207 RepID=A0A7X6N0E3_9STRE|nr:low molecular weight protein-tyrosine-phosphatase [Streptococcus ovuberis]NKZ19764.1 low molecular weight phosphotyrosine protein phosphatase [Streptococcus ovuberis]